MNLASRISGLRFLLEWRFLKKRFTEAPAIVAKEVLHVQFKRVDGSLSQVD